MKKLLGILITLSMIVALFAGMNLTALADDGEGIETSYIDENGVEQTVYAIPITEYTQELTEGWYVVPRADVFFDELVPIEITNRLKVKVDSEDGGVHIILSDGAYLKNPGGISVAPEKSLTIYGQSGGTGILEIDQDSDEQGVYKIRTRASGDRNYKAKDLDTVITVK